MAVITFMTFNTSGRNVQRERANADTSIKRSTSDSNTMKSHHLLQVDEEISMSRSAYDLKVIEMLMKCADTEIKKVNLITLFHLNCFYFFNNAFFFLF